MKLRSGPLSISRIMSRGVRRPYGSFSSILTQIQVLSCFRPFAFIIYYLFPRKFSDLTNAERQPRIASIIYSDSPLSITSAWFYHSSKKARFTAPNLVAMDWTFSLLATKVLKTEQAVFLTFISLCATMISSKPLTNPMFAIVILFGAWNSMRSRINSRFYITFTDSFLAVFKLVLRAEIAYSPCYFTLSTFSLFAPALEELNFFSARFNHLMSASVTWWKSLGTLPSYSTLDTSNNSYQLIIFK